MIELALSGQPAQCRAAARELERLREQFGAAQGELDYTAALTGRYWQGLAAEDFRRLVTGIAAEAEDLRAKATQLVAALDEFALAVERVRAEMEAARHDALAAGLVLQGEVIQPPPTLTTDVALLTAYGSVAPGYAVDHRVATYWRCHSRVEYARNLERRAHEDLQSAARSVLRAPFLEHWLGKLGLLPAGSTASVIGLWAGNAGLFAASATADWATKVKFGEFRPVLGNQPMRATDLTRGQRFTASFRATNWRPLPGMEAPHARWTSAGRALGVAGAAVAGGTSAWSQWQADADNPTIRDTEQIARSTTVGVTTGVGAYAGAVGGAQLGGAIGTFFVPGAGTVVGAAIGGAVGGLLGTEAGSAVGGLARGAVGDAAGAIAGGLGKTFGKVF